MNSYVLNEAYIYIYIYIYLFRCFRTQRNAARLFPMPGCPALWILRHTGTASASECSSENSSTNGRRTIPNLESGGWLNVEFLFKKNRGHNNLFSLWRNHGSNSLNRNSKLVKITGKNFRNFMETEKRLQAWERSLRSKCTQQPTGQNFRATMCKANSGFAR